MKIIIEVELEDLQRGRFIWAEVERLAQETKAPLSCYLIGLRNPPAAEFNMNYDTLPWPSMTFVGSITIRK